MDIKAWAKKRKWDIVFFAVLGLIIFVPSFRMATMSTVQKIRMLFVSPSEIASEKQVEVKSYDWELVDLEGNVVNFSNSQNKVIILNFWATWCPPCVAEMPAFQKVFDSYGDKVDFYFVSNENVETITRFLDKHQYKLPIYIPMMNPPKEFESNSLPTTFVLNKQGKIVIKEIGAYDWASSKFMKQLDKFLEE